MGGQKKPTISAMRKRMTREQRLEAKRKLKEEREKEKGTYPYLLERDMEEKAWSIIAQMKYVTPFILTSKLRIKLSRSRDLLRKLAQEGKLELIEKNRELEIYRPLAIQKALSQA